MAPLTKSLCFAVILTASSAVLIPFTARCETASARVADAVAPWSSFISEAAERFAIPAAWIRAVMRVESHGNVKAVSAKGAVGLMQIMPATYAELRERYALGGNPYDPHDNIVAGAAYLREMHDRFGPSGFLAAYNVGPTRYDEHLATGRPLPDETRNYIASLAPLLPDPQSGDNAITAGELHNWRRAPLFVARSQRKSSDTRMSFTPQSSPVGHERGAVDLLALTPLLGGLFVKQAPAPSKP